MQEERHNHSERGVTRYSKEAERKFFFYATIAMFIFYAYLKLFVR